MGLELNQIDDVEIFLSELAGSSGQIDLFTNGALGLGVGVKHINANTRENSGSFFDGQSIIGFSINLISGQIGVVIPKEGKAIELKLKDDFLTHLVH